MSEPEIEVDIYVPMPPRSTKSYTMIPKKKWKRIDKKLKRFKRMEEDRYVRVLGILHRDMYDILVEIGNTENKDPLPTLQKMASRIVRTEISTGVTLIKVTYDDEKSKFDMKFK